MIIKHAPVHEVIERIKDIISPEINGFVYDYHVAEVLYLEPSSLRVYKSKDKLPLKNIAIFCVLYDIDLRTLIKN